MPGSNPRVEVKPLSLESRYFGFFPAESSGDGPLAPDVVGAVNTTLELIPHCKLTGPSIRNIAIPPHTTAVMVMDIKAVSKSMFKVCIVSLPRDNLSVRPAQVNVAKNMARVGQEYPADVRKRFNRTLRRAWA
jgi:hypothetical protein